MDTDTVRVLPHGPAYAVVCLTHGTTALWGSPALASFDAMGHMAAHHSPR